MLYSIKSTTTFYKDVPNIIICLEVFSGCSDPPLKNKWESESNKNELILYQCKEKYLISCEFNLLFVTNTYLAQLEMLFTWNCIKLFSSLMPEFWHETCPSLCKRVSEIITEWVLFFSRDDGHLSQSWGMCREVSKCILSLYGFCCFLIVESSLWLEFRLLFVTRYGNSLVRLELYSICKKSYTYLLFYIIFVLYENLCTDVPKFVCIL